MRSFTTFAILLAGLAGVAWAFGQEPLALRVDVSLVTLDVEVTDSVGRPVNNLAESDFEIYENGTQQDLRSFDSVETPYNIMLLFDCSPSTEPAWPFLLQAMERFLQTLRGQDRMAIAQFGGRFRILRKLLSRSEEAIDVKIQPYDLACSGTDFYGAVNRAVDELKVVKGRKGAVILTDGEHDSISRQRGTLLLPGRSRYVDAVDDKDFQKLLRTVAGNSVALYFVAVNTDLNPDEFDTQEIYNKQQLRSRMEVLAATSGGRVAFPRKPDEVVKLYEQLAHDLGSSYSLGYVPGNPNRNGTYRKIEVRVRDRALHVKQSREGYVAR